MGAKMPDLDPIRLVTIFLREKGFSVVHAHTKWESMEVRAPIDFPDRNWHWQVDDVISTTQIFRPVCDIWIVPNAPTFLAIALPNQYTIKSTINLADPGSFDAILKCIDEIKFEHSIQKE